MQQPTFSQLQLTTSKCPTRTYFKGCPPSFTITSHLLRLEKQPPNLLTLASWLVNSPNIKNTNHVLLIECRALFGFKRRALYLLKEAL